MTDDFDSMRQSVLDRMERNNRLVRTALVGAAIAEVALIADGLAVIDFSVRTEKMMYVFFVATIMMVALGMVALGAHISRTADRILAVLEKH